MKFINDITQINRKKWEILLENSEFASPFQTPQYYAFLKETNYTDGVVFSCTVGGELKVLMVITLMQEPGIKKYFSKRGIIFGGPVLSDDVSNTELAFFLKEVSKKLKGNAIYLETRNFFSYFDYKEAFRQSGWFYEPYLNFQQSLHDIEKDKILSKFKYNKRRQIKLSLKNGATYHLCNSEAEVAKIYNILEELYKTRVKVPLPPLSFFTKLFHKNIMKVFVVKHEGKTIGGSFCPVFEGKAIYTYYYCGIRNYHKRIFPTHLAVLAAMEYAIEHKIPVLDFMGAGKPDADYGVRKYKSEFGGTLVEHGRFVKVLNPMLYKLGVFGIELIKKLS